LVHGGSRPTASAGREDRGELVVEAELQQGLGDGGEVGWFGGQQQVDDALAGELGHRRAAHVLGWCPRPPGRDERDEPLGDLGSVRVGLVDLNWCAAVRADRWLGRRGHGRIGPVTAGEVSDAVHGVLREHCGPLGPHEQHAATPSRDGDGHMSRQQRIRLDRVAIVDRINHDLQRLGSVGREELLRVPWTTADNCAPAVSHRPS
jgi:hypothetical protein